jgi:hypothetical protein
MSSMAISVTSFSTVSLIAIVPDSECSTPTLIVSAASTGVPKLNPAAVATAISARRWKNVLRCIWFSPR